MVDWLICDLVGCSIVWLIRRLNCRLFGWYVVRLFGWLVGWLMGCSDELFVAWCVDWVGWLVGWLIDGFAFIGWLID